MKSQTILLIFATMLIAFLVKQNYDLGKVLELQANAMQNHEDRLVNIEYKLNLNDK